MNDNDFNIMINHINNRTRPSIIARIWGVERIVNRKILIQNLTFLENLLRVQEHNKILIKIDEKKNKYYLSEIYNMSNERLLMTYIMELEDLDPNETYQFFVNIAARGLYEDYRKICQLLKKPTYSTFRTSAVEPISRIAIFYDPIN